MAIYLYCLRKKKTPLSGVKTTLSVVKTIDKGEAYTVPYKELEAVVSPVDLKEFGSEEIQKKAQEDVNWIKEKAQIHEHVIERAMGLGGPPANACGVSQWRAGKISPVIPMKFGTIFKTKGNLEEMMGKYYPKFKASLEKLKGKQEWGVKVYFEPAKNKLAYFEPAKNKLAYFEPAKNKLAYLDEEVFKKQLKTLKTPRMVTRRGSSEVKGLASLPKGMEFFVKKQMEETIKKEKNRELEGVLKGIFENLQKLAVKANQGKNLDKAITGKKEPMVLNVNLLIRKEKVAEFQKEVQGLKTKYQNQGLIIQESGPWPPYNFVKI